MTTTLSEGVKVPDVGSVNWAGDLEVNWNLLNGALANLSGNVKLDRDNTWTGEQSFTLPIVGSITGTAAKAIADEDGTSIKTGYGKLAGANVWTNVQNYKSFIRFTNDSYASGTPSANIFYASLQGGGYVNNTWSAPFAINNAIRTNGYSDTSFRTYSQTSNTLTGFVHETNADASDIAFRPIVNGTHKLGSSSYQWSSVYAQTYYYNGTQWGLDKANVWTEANRYTGYVDLQYTQSGRYSDIRWMNELDETIACFRNYADNLTLGKRYTGKTAWYNGAQFSLLSNGLAVIKGYDGTNYSNVVLSGNALYPDTPNINLGISSKKWKTLNGINPGALSLPDLSSDGYVDLSSNLTENVQYTYTPVADGWLALYCQTTGFHAENAVGIFNGGGSPYGWACSTTSAINLLRGTTYHGAVMLPVKAGIPYLCLLTINSSTTLSSKRLYFYKAQGNV